MFLTEYLPGRFRYDRGDDESSEEEDDEDEENNEPVISNKTFNDDENSNNSQNKCNNHVNETVESTVETKPIPNVGTKRRHSHRSEVSEDDEVIEQRPKKLQSVVICKPVIKNCKLFFFLFSTRPIIRPIDLKKIIFK